MIRWERVNELRDEIGEEDFAEVAEMFLAEVDEVIARLKSLPDSTRIEEDLHFLKGSALNLGFDAFSKLCQDGEARAASGHGDSIALQPVFDIYDRSRAAFQRGTG